MRAIGLLLIIIGVPAAATDRDHEQDQNQDQAQDQAQDQNQDQGQSQTARGGDGGHSNAVGNVQNSFRSIGLAHGAPIPPVCPPGLVPGKRGKRALAAGVVSLSAVCVPPTDEENAAMQVVRDHELELARIAVEAARAYAEADRAAAERAREETKSAMLRAGCEVENECEAYK